VDAPAGGPAVVVGNGSGGTPYPGLKLSPLDRRSNGDIDIRTFTGELQTGTTACDPTNQQCAPQWCNPQGYVIAEISDPAIAATQGASVIGFAPGSRVTLLGASVVGTAEGHPVQLAMVRVSPDIASVQLSTASGKDSGVPTKGLVTLAVAGSGGPATVRGLDKQGQPLQTLNVSDGAAVNTVDCSPAPVQPPKAGTPPADAKTAEAAIRASFETVFTHPDASVPYEPLTRVVDGQKLRGALDQARKQFPEALNTVTVTTGNLIFTSPTEAAVEFTLAYTGGAPYGTHYGKAVLVDGSWFVTRDTYCMALGWAGGSCP
jgi:hypothetical protein